MLRRRSVVLVMGSVLCFGMPAQTAPEATRRVGTIDLFGYAGWNGDDPQTAAARKQLEARVGTNVTMAAIGTFRRRVQGDVVAATGKPATDVAVVCCNDTGDLSVFVGLQGESAIPLEQQATPTGEEALPAEALSLYQNDADALQAADTRGASTEDASQGYALSQNPAARAIEQQMRAFAVAHTEVIARVLRRSGAVQQRRAAATLLGYAQRSNAQVHALEQAMHDDDDTVRSNAVRALTALAAAGPLPGLNVETVIGLLYSGVWTDRSRAGALLLTLTVKRDPKLLKTLEDQALPPLMEGAEWQSGPHASPFARVLGRVLGMPDDQTSELFNGGRVSDIVARAKAMEGRDARH